MTIILIKSYAQQHNGGSKSMSKWSQLSKHGSKGPKIEAKKKSQKKSEPVEQQKIYKEKKMIICISREIK